MSFAPVSDVHWPPQLQSMQGGFATQLNVYRAMAHHPPLLLAWANLREHIVRQNTFSAVELEIIILRTGCRRGSPYEWAHHVLRGRKAGLDDRRIRSVATRPASTNYADDLLLIAAVDELVDSNRLSPATLTALTARFGRAGVLDLMATVGMYTTLAYLVNSFDTPLDTDVAAELAVRPLAD